MQIGMRQFSAESVEWLRSEAASGASRSLLAEGLCELEGWSNARGEPCLSSARKALPAIASRIGLALPPAGSPAGRGRPPSGYPDKAFEGGLADLGEVSAEPAPEAESREFRAMMETHHDRGAPAHPGARIFYRLRSGRIGRVGGGVHQICS